MRLCYDSSGAYLSGVVGQLAYYYLNSFIVCDLSAQVQLVLALRRFLRI